MTCAENVALPLRKHFGLSMTDARRQAEQLLDRVRMGAFADTYPAALGDGMRKRVAIARALTLRPEFMLFDEPTTSLDPVSARRVDALIRELSRGMNVTCIVVSHDLNSIFSIADRIVFLHEGEVRLLGTQADFKNSDDPVVQQFINGRAEGPI
jgi:phospholipid/cholesterol/gamma-HCH transport system ATP-binding protein